MKPVAKAYIYGGITLLSDIPLPELPLLEQPNASSPVHIRLASVPHPLPEAIEIDPDCFASGTYYWLRIRGIGCYLVTNGSQILVHPDPGAHALDVRAYLLGTLFVALCQQRQLLPLHASAVSSNGGVVAFLARSGQGKSSLAALLAERGFSILADDVCLVDTQPTSPAMVVPTAPWLKLWRNSLNHLGLPVQGLERVFTEDDKYRLPLVHSRKREPIAKLVFLENDNVLQPTLEKLSPVQAIPRLIDLTHQVFVLQATGQMQENFLRCTRISSQATAYRLIRPWGMEHLKATVDELETVLLRPRAKGTLPEP